MNNTYRNWFLANYDQYVLAEVDGSQIGKTSDALAHRFLDALDSGDLPTESPDMDYARSLFRSIVEPERQKRRGSFKKNAEYLLDALRNPDEGIHVEPFLDVVYPMGTADGRDKALRYWTEQDLIESSMERYRNAAAAMESAKQYDDISQELIAAMHGRSAKTVGQVFIQVSA